MYLEQLSCAYRYRVEDVTKEATLKNICSVVGVNYSKELHSKVNKVSSFTNHRKETPKVTLDSLRKHSAALADEIAFLAEEYGYDITS